MSRSIDVAHSAGPWLRSPPPGAVVEEAPARLPGADLLRLASLFSIVLFHIVLRDSQAMSGPAGRFPEALDALLCVTAVFDNRSMAILSIFLLITRHGGDSPGSLLAERTHRLLVPYLAWTLIYAVLDLAVAMIAGRPAPAMARITDPGFWLSALFLATSTGHLHFLPTLFVLTVIWMVWRPRLSVAAAIPALAATSALRVFIEYLVLYQGNAPSLGAMAVLSLARLVEYLPIVALAGALAGRADLHPRARAWIAAAVVGLLALSIGLQPGAFAGLGPGSGLLAWTIVQAMAGATIMAAAATCLLSLNRADVPMSPRVAAWRDVMVRNSLGIFLVHPFVCSLLDLSIGFDAAFGVGMILPKFVVVIGGSLAITALLRRGGRLAAIV